MKEGERKRDMEDFFLNKNLKDNPFRVPENYFEELNQKLSSLNNIHELEKETEWQVPEQYFDQLEGQIMAQINLPDKQKDANFQVPEGYFESLEAKIIAQTSEKKETPVKMMSFARYAAAAAILIFCALSFYFIDNSQTSINKELANIPDQEIVEYLEYSSDPNDMTLIIENASIEDFEMDYNRPIAN